jgi:hypothetical protein
MTSSGWKALALFLCGAAGVFVPQAGDATKAKGAEQATRVTLTRRAESGPYATSAYSFRYASQDLAVHHNAVDLVFNDCGLVHISAYGGQQNRVARVKGKDLADVNVMPEEGWLKACFRPEKDALYVMVVDDGSTRFRVKFHVLEAKDDKVTLEWAPFREAPAGENGTMGHCTGKHDCS